MPRQKKPPKSKAVYIYGLAHPVSGVVRYVGKAIDPDGRLHSHLRDAHKIRRPVYHWIRKLQKNGLEAVLVILEETTESAWEQCEKAWISKFGLENLLNVTPGGDGMNSETVAAFWEDPEYRAKQHASAKARMSRPEEKKKAAERLRIPPEVRSEMARKQWEDPEIRERMSKALSESLKEYYAEPENRKRLVDRANLPENIEKSRASGRKNAGRKHKDETRRRMSKAHQGLRASEQTKENQSKARKLWWAKKREEDAKKRGE